MSDSNVNDTPNDNDHSLVEYPFRYSQEYLNNFMAALPDGIDCETLPWETMLQ